jgi:hypothetical protein
MPGLDSPQFKDYAFRVKKTKHGTTASVAKIDHKLAYTEHLGSMDIYHDRTGNEQNQRDINAYPENQRHGMNTDHDTGQRSWSGGNMDSDKPYVGWAGIAKVPGHSRLLQGLAAVLVHEHGSMPAADNALSDTGARLARGTARKYGMKGGSYNPEMESGFTELSEESVRREAESSWRRAEVTHTQKGGKQYSAAQASSIATDMDQQYRVTPKKKASDTPIHPDQLKLL